MLRRLVRCFSTKPTLSESDLIEKYVRGSGPGGQATNKTSNAVDLRHIPTGTRVWCHQTRSLEINRHIARKIMVDKLDVLYNGTESKLAKKIEKVQKKKASRAKKARKKYSRDKDDAAIYTTANIAEDINHDNDPNAPIAEDFADSESTIEK